MTTFEFPTYRRPRIHKLSSARATESEDGPMPTENLPTENLSDLLGRVSRNSMGEIDSLIGEFGRLRGKLQTDGERIQREIEEYAALGQQVMQLTKTISESVEKVRSSVDRPTTERELASAARTKNYSPKTIRSQAILKCSRALL